jgi:acyl carrier protein
MDAVFGDCACWSHERYLADSDGAALVIGESYGLSNFERSNEKRRVRRFSDYAFRSFLFAGYCDRWLDHNRESHIPGGSDTGYGCHFGGNCRIERCRIDSLDGDGNRRHCERDIPHYNKSRQRDDDGHCFCRGEWRKQVRKFDGKIIWMLEEGMNIEADLQRFIASEVVLEGGVSAGEPLISSGKVDSLGLLQILGYIEQNYGVTLLASGTPRDFESVEALANAIRNARREQV